MSGVSNSSANSYGSSLDSVKELKKLENKEPNIKNTEEAKAQNENIKTTDKDSIGQLSKGSKKLDPAHFDGSIFNDIQIHPANTGCFAPEEGGKAPHAPTSLPPDIIDILTKIKDPTTSVEDIRNSQGEKRDDLLLGFKDKIDKMSTSQLREVRDYLVEQMVSPTNNDDKLLGKLLDMVNHELDNKKPSFKPDFEMTTKAFGEEGGAIPHILIGSNVIDHIDFDKKGSGPINDIKADPFSQKAQAQQQKAEVIQNDIKKDPFSQK